MDLTAIYAQLCCRDLARARPWFETLFGRPADAEPMEGLAEWHHGSAAGLQLFEDSQKAGRGTLTLIVGDLAAERDRLDGSIVETAAVEPGDAVSVMQLTDPDGNLVVLAQPRTDR
ncbi:VOC family protein [Rhodobacteraceae bacterium CCMM004]|nr:VOC family protein [Rhodobacteraceae bacterium CCMM004]